MDTVNNLTRKGLDWAGRAVDHMRDLTTSTKEKVSLSLSLTKPNYIAGETLRGQLRLVVHHGDASKKFKFSAVRVAIVGREAAQLFLEPEKLPNYDAPFNLQEELDVWALEPQGQYQTTPHYRSNTSSGKKKKKPYETFTHLYHVITVAGYSLESRRTENAVTLEGGTYDYPFELELPTRCPCCYAASTRNMIAALAYRVEATVYVQGSAELRSALDFGVMPAARASTLVQESLHTQIIQASGADGTTSNNHNHDNGFSPNVNANSRTAAVDQLMRSLPRAVQGRLDISAFGIDPTNSGASLKGAKKKKKKGFFCCGGKSDVVEKAEPIRDEFVEMGLVLSTNTLLIDNGLGLSTLLRLDAGHTNEEGKQQTVNANVSEGGAGQVPYATAVPLPPPAPPAAAANNNNNNNENTNGIQYDPAAKNHSPNNNNNNNNENTNGIQYDAAAKPNNGLKHSNAPASASSNEGGREGPSSVHQKSQNNDYPEALPVSYSLPIPPVPSSIAMCSPTKGKISNNNNNNNNNNNQNDPCRVETYAAVHPLRGYLTIRNLTKTKTLRRVRLHLQQYIRITCQSNTSSYMLQHLVDKEYPLCSTLYGGSNNRASGRGLGPGEDLLNYSILIGFPKMLRLASCMPRDLPVPTMKTNFFESHLVLQLSFPEELPGGMTAAHTAAGANTASRFELLNSGVLDLISCIDGENRVPNLPGTFTGTLIVPEDNQGIA